MDESESPSSWGRLPKDEKPLPGFPDMIEKFWDSLSIIFDETQ